MSRSAADIVPHNFVGTEWGTCDECGGLPYHKNVDSKMSVEERAALPHVHPKESWPPDPPRASCPVCGDTRLRVRGDGMVWCDTTEPSHFHDYFWNVVSHGKKCRCKKCLQP